MEEVGWMAAAGWLLARRTRRAGAFVASHSRLLAWTAVGAAAATAAAGLGVRALAQRLTAAQGNMLAEFKRQRFFDATQLQAVETMDALVPELRAALDARVDVPSSAALRAAASRDERIALWGLAKVRAVAKGLGAVYAVVLTDVLLRVQLNLLAHYLYLDAQHQQQLLQLQQQQHQHQHQDPMFVSSGSQSSMAARVASWLLGTGGGAADARAAAPGAAVTNDTRNTFLEFVAHLAHEGLGPLIDRITAVVADALADVGLERVCEHRDFVNVVLAVRAALEPPPPRLDGTPFGAGGDPAVDVVSAAAAASSSSSSAAAAAAGVAPRDHGLGYVFLRELLLPPEESQAALSDRNLVLLLNETRDVLESPAFDAALRACLDVGFGQYLEDLRNAMARSGGGDAQPLAKLIPVLCSVNTDLLFCEFRASNAANQMSCNRLVQNVSTCRPLQSFAFEIFSASL